MVSIIPEKETKKCCQNSVVKPLHRVTALASSAEQSRAEQQYEHS